jgi:hypothetical protein
MAEAEKPQGGTNILNRVMTEYNEGQDYLRAKKLKWVQQLILMNNLARDEQSISSSMLPSFFNRVFSNLYSDVLQTTFMPAEDSDYKKTETLNKLQQSDFKEMEMWLLNYDWTWDACFFAEGFIETLNFDKKRKVMKPEVVNPLYMVQDPFFSDVKKWRYYGKWRTFSKYELVNLKDKKVILQAFDISRISAGLEAELWDYKNRRDAAKLGTNVADSSNTTNDIYQILEHFTYSDEGDVMTNGKKVSAGKKIIVWTDKNFSQEIRVQLLSDYIPDDEPWPIVKKQIFREPHSSLSISVPDFIEDKHRARSVLLNLSFMAAKDDANPIYLYVADNVDDVSQFYSRQIFQHIAVTDLNNSVKPMETKGAMSASLNAFMQLIAAESSDVIGSALVQPTAQKGKKSATDSAMQQQAIDLTSSLQAKVISIAEKEFWSQWYLRLINPKNMKDADEKVITLTSVNGITFENIKLDNFKTKFPPKVEIVSKKEAEYKELVVRRDLMQNYPIIVKSMDERSLANFNKYIYFPKFGMQASTIDLIVPSTVDQLKARMENELLDQNKFTPVDPSDDDEAHMYEHRMAKNTPRKWAHYFIHQQHLAIKNAQKAKQEAQKGEEESGDGQGGAPPGGGPAMGMKGNNAVKKNKIPIQQDKQNPQKAAVPLTKETANNVQQKGVALL